MLMQRNTISAFAFTLYIPKTSYSPFRRSHIETHLRRRLTDGDETARRSVQSALEMSRHPTASFLFAGAMIHRHSYRFTGRAGKNTGRFDYHSRPRNDLSHGAITRQEQ